MIIHNLGGNSATELQSEHNYTFQSPEQVPT